MGSTAKRIMRWLGKALLWLIVALLVLAAVGMVYQAVATERAEEAHPPPGETVDVGDHELHIDCVGQGTPTVVLEAALGNTSARFDLLVAAYVAIAHVFGLERGRRPAPR